MIGVIWRKSLRDSLLTAIFLHLTHNHPDLSLLPFTVWLCTRLLADPIYGNDHLPIIGSALETKFSQVRKLIETSVPEFQDSGEQRTSKERTNNHPGKVSWLF